MKGRIGIVFGLVALILAAFVVVRLYLFPTVPDENEITEPRILAARAVCRQVPIPDDFLPVSTEWGQRVGGPSARYSTYWKTGRSFDEIHRYWLERLPALGFSGGDWHDSVHERQVAYGKDNIRIIIAYRLSYTSRWEMLRDKLGGRVWNVYLDCDDKRSRE